MFFFKKKADPLAEELRRLERERRRLERQAAAIEYELLHPPAPPPAVGEQAARRGAKFSHDPPPEPLNASGGRTRLKIQRAKLRNRIIVYCCVAVLILTVLALVVYRCIH